MTDTHDTPIAPPAEPGQPPAPAGDDGGTGDGSGGRLPISALLTAMAISLVGNNITLIVVPWFVLKTTGSAMQTGITAVMITLPIVLSAFLGGALIDRVGHRRSSIVTDLLAGACIGLIPLLHSMGGLEFWHVLLLVFLRGVFDTGGETARVSLLPDAAAASGVPIEKANSWYEVINRGSRVVGVTLGGMLVLVIGFANVLYIDALSYVASALLVLIAVPAWVSRQVPSQSSRVGYLRDVREGVSFLRLDRLVLTLVVASTISNMFETPLTLVVLPAYVEDFMGNDSSILGAMLAAISLGTAIGAIAYASFARRVSRRPLFLLLFAAAALRFFLLAPVLPSSTTVALLLAVSLFEGPLNPLLSTVLYERIPPDIRARVLGAVIAVSSAAIPVGAFAFGWALQTFGTIDTILVAGGIYISVSVPLLLSRSLHGMDQPSPVAASALYPLPDGAEEYRGWAYLNPPVGSSATSLEAWRWRSADEWEQVILHAGTPVYVWPSARTDRRWAWSPQHEWCAVDARCVATERAGHGDDETS